MALNSKLALRLKIMHEAMRNGLSF